MDAVEEPEGLYYLNMYTNITIHKGKVLVVARSGNICSWDMDGSTAVEPAILPPPDIDIDYTRGIFYLATSSGGDLQLVYMFGDNDDVGKDTRWWRIVFDFEWSFCPRRVLLHELDTVIGAW